MKKIILFLLLGISYSCSKSFSISIPAKKTSELAYPSFTLYDLSLINNSNYDVAVKKVDFSKNDSIEKSFITSKDSKSFLMDESKKLFFTNTSDSILNLKIKLKQIKDTESKPIVLKNKSSQTIPLFYANGVTINLAPLRGETYWFRKGVKVFFTDKGERFLLFEVTDELLSQKTIDVIALLEKRKEEKAL